MRGAGAGETLQMVYSEENNRSKCGQPKALVKSRRPFGSFECLHDASLTFSPHVTDNHAWGISCK